MNFTMKNISIVLLISFSLFSACKNPNDKTENKILEYFSNPILEDGPDPFVYLHSDNYYYIMVTRGDLLQLWKSKSFTDLDSAETKVIWVPPDSGSNSCCIWAPEIHYFDNTWYIYYSATDKSKPFDMYRRIHVLKNSANNPFENTWVDIGQVHTKYPGIDGTVFEYSGVRYFAYSPYIGNKSGISIAIMSSPTTLENEVNIGLPIYDWEKTPPRAIMEGPQFLLGPKDLIFIVYSAGACWDDNYGLGLFSAKKNSDLMDPKSWTRSDHQVFEQCPDSNVYGPGHNCFTKSPDGKEDWIIYHAKRYSSNECAGRSMRAQIFTWDNNGFPLFGKPLSLLYPHKKPSGIIH